MDIDQEFEDFAHRVPFCWNITHGRFLYRVWFSDLIDQWVVLCGIGFQYFHSMKDVGQYIQKRGF